MKKLSVVLIGLLFAGLAAAQSYMQDAAFVRNMTPQTSWKIQRAEVASTITTFAGLIADDTTWSKTYWMPPTTSIHAYISNAQDSSHYQVELYASNSPAGRMMKVGLLAWTNQSGIRIAQTEMDSIGSWWAMVDDLYPPDARYFRFLVRATTGHHKLTNTDYVEFDAVGKTD